MQPGKESFVEKRKISRFRLIRRDVEQTKDVKKMLAFFKSAFKTAEENNLALYAGSWSFFFILSAVPLVLLLIMACDALGVNVTFLLEDMPRELSDGLKLIFSVAEEASKGATFILVLTSLYSSTRLFSYMLKDGEMIYGLRRKNGIFRKIVGFMLLFLVFLMFLAAATVLLLGKKISAAIFSGKWGTIAGKLVLNLLVISAVYLIIVTVNLFLCPRRNKAGAVMLGSLLSLAVTVLGSIGFATYLHYFASYTDLYGNLAAIVVLMLWVYITMLGMVSGNALIKILIEKQTVRNTAKECRLPEKSEEGFR